MEDQELLRRMQRDPEGALAELGRKYGPLAAGVAGRVLVGRQEDVEEVVSDVLLAIWKNRRKLEAATLRGFVITTARNLAIDRWRVLRRRQEAPLFDEDEGATEFLESRVLTRVLAREIAQLDPPDGEIFLRHHLLLETAAEIGERFGLTESAVRARLHRMRKKLKREVPR